MSTTYIQVYTHLYHGTTESRAVNIVDNQKFIPSKRGWCGPGVYFYDNKPKAWWSAHRTCREEEKKGKRNVVPDIVIADINPLLNSDVLDLRAPRGLEQFSRFVDDFLSQSNFEIEEDVDEQERINLKREMLLSFFCRENGIKIIIGYFKQKSQEKIDDLKIFADAWQLAIGIETIYCAKDTSIIHNIRRRE